jgi:hypothetical protein
MALILMMVIHGSCLTTAGSTMPQQDMITRSAAHRALEPGVLSVYLISTVTSLCLLRLLSSPRPNAVGLSQSGTARMLCSCLSSRDRRLRCPGST